MKKNGMIFMIFLLFASFFTHTAIAADDDYRLGFGDVISITFGASGYEAGLQDKEFAVRPDGKIAFPLIGELLVEGLTASELTQTLNGLLGKYMKDPQVTISFVKFRTVRVYVLGEANNPGMYEISKSHNLLDAIGSAGGFTKYANKKEVYVVRKSTGLYQKADLNKLLKKGDLSQNYELSEGDVVYLTPNGLSFVNDVLPYIAAAAQIKSIIEN